MTKTKMKDLPARVQEFLKEHGRKYKLPYNPNKEVTMVEVLQAIAMAKKEEKDVL